MTLIYLEAWHFHNPFKHLRWRILRKYLMSTIIFANYSYCRNITFSHYLFCKINTILISMVHFFNLRRAFKPLHQFALPSLVMSSINTIKNVLRNVSHVPLYIWHQLFQFELSKLFARFSYCQLWTYFTPFSSVSIVNFEHVIVVWKECRSRPSHCVNTIIPPNFLVWKFCGKAQFPQSFGRFSRNSGNRAFP